MKLEMVGSVLASLLIRCDVTAAEVARRLGVPDSTITRILRNERGITIEMLNCICDELHQSRSEVFAECLLTLHPGMNRESVAFRRLHAALKFLDRKSSSRVSNK